MFLTLIVHFTIKNFNIFLFRLLDVFDSDSAFTIKIVIVMLTVTWDPTGKNITDVLEWTSHYLILAVLSCTRPGGGLIN
jgi:hypothetical protein